MIRKQLLLAYFLLPVLVIGMAVRWWDVPRPRAPKPPTYEYAEVLMPNTLVANCSAESSKADQIIPCVVTGTNFTWVGMWSAGQRSK